MSEDINKWDYRFMSLAEQVGTWSKDKSTKVGCIIVGDKRTILATGYNGFPRDTDDDVEERHERPKKYMWTEHSERNAIYSAARNGIKLQDSIIYVPWLPCIDCARAIKQSGIVKVVTKKLHSNDPLALRWKDSHEASLNLFNESGVSIVWLENE